MCIYFFPTAGTHQSRQPQGKYQHLGSVHDSRRARPHAGRRRHRQKPQKKGTRRPPPPPASLPPTANIAAVATDCRINARLTTTTTTTTPDNDDFGNTVGDAVVGVNVTGSAINAPNTSAAVSITVTAASIHHRPSPPRRLTQPEYQHARHCKKNLSGDKIPFEPPGAVSQRVIIIGEQGKDGGGAEGVGRYS